MNLNYTDKTIIRNQHLINRTQKEIRLINIAKCYARRTKKKIIKYLILAIEIKKCWKENNI